MPESGRESRAEPPVVVGTGAVCPAGLGAGAFWRAVTAGRPVTGPVCRFDVSGYPTGNAGELPATALSELDDLVPWHASLAARYLAAAALEALREAGVDPARPGARVGLFAGTVMGVRPVLDRGILRGKLSVAGTEWGDPGRLLDVVHEVVAVDGPSVLSAPGCSAGNSAIALGASAIAAGEVDLAVCGGADELSHEVFAMFTSLRGLSPDLVRPFDAARRGTLPSEGAGVVVLENPASAAARAARPLARVLSHASYSDAFHLTQPRPDGAGLLATLATCLDRARLSAANVDWVCAHGSGTVASDGIEAAALGLALGGSGRRPAVSSLKGVVGHAEGAAAALEAVAAVRALTEQFIPGNPTMRRPDACCSGIDLEAVPGRPGRVGVVASPSFGFGGGVCTVLFGHADG
jgi:3-oxoacyl-[acyl-carrier-protein] synthase II